MKGLSFVYVVDGPRLQAQAIILAASLRRHQPLARQFAYCPESGLAEVPGFVRAALEGLGVMLCPLPQPPRVFAQPYPHGNKILSLALSRPGTTHSVFLDTDMVMLAPLEPADLPGPMQVSVVPEGIRSWGKDEDRWHRAYGFFDLPMPSQRIRLLRGRRAWSPPYFNAGFVATNEADMCEGRGFGALWLETASAFDHRAPVGGKRPWLDQITLPLTMARFGFAPKIIDETNNCSISNGRNLELLAAPRIIHYHRSGFLRGWPGNEALIEAARAAAAPGDLAQMDALLTLAGFLGAIEPLDGQPLDEAEPQ